MIINLIKVGKNGQLEFDFESVEAKTSEAFVHHLKMKIKGYEVKEATMRDVEIDGDNYIEIEFMTIFRTGNKAMCYSYLYSRRYNIYEYSYTYWSNSRKKWVKKDEY